MISVVIANWKNPKLLSQSLKLIKDSFLPKTDYEIIVIDIETSPETAYVAKEYDVVFKPFKENIGYSRGLNEGFKLARGEYIISLNSDIVPQKGSIEKLRDKLKEDSSIGLIGPQLLNFDSTLQVSRFRFYRLSTILARRTFLSKIIRHEKNRFEIGDIPLNRSIDADWLMGSAYMTTRAALNKVGGHDENLFAYFSDVDWSKRFWENGYRVHFFTDSVMWHYHHRASKGKSLIIDMLFNRATRIHIKDALRYFLKHGLKNKTYINEQ